MKGTFSRLDCEKVGYKRQNFEVIFWSWILLLQKERHFILFMKLCLKRQDTIFLIPIQINMKIIYNIVTEFVWNMMPYISVKANTICERALHNISDEHGIYIHSFDSPKFNHRYCFFSYLLSGPRALFASFSLRLLLCLLYLCARVFLVVGH
jgi:hypothetical protein